jgi:OFA family oxalate/formate antiporter-like MFS transporter
LVTIAGTCALLVLGVPNAWSVIKANIPNEWVWSEFQKSLPFSFACVSFSIMTLVGARLLNRFGPRIIVGVGGILAGTGIIISSQSPSPWVFTIGFGILLGTGIGFVYASVNPTALKWFPASKTGLISGIVMAGFGMGSAWVAPLARTLIESIGLQSTMLYLGIGILIVVVAFAQHMQYPPIDYIPADSSPEKTVSVVKETHFTPGETIKTWQFYLLWIAFAFGSGAGRGYWKFSPDSKRPDRFASCQRFSGICSFNR